MFLRKPAFYKGFHIYFPEGGMKIDESDKIMLVKPLHGRRAQRNAQPVEHHAVQQSGGKRHALRHSDRHERECPRRFHTAQTAWSGHCGTQCIGQQEDERRFNRIR